MIGEQGNIRAIRVICGENGSEDWPQKHPSAGPWAPDRGSKYWYRSQSRQSSLIFAANRSGQGPRIIEQQAAQDRRTHGPHFPRRSFYWRARATASAPRRITSAILHACSRAITGVTHERRGAESTRAKIERKGRKPVMLFPQPPPKTPRGRARVRRTDASRGRGDFRERDR
jgi:hypothetical protein